MGNFVLEVEAVGGHGCQREVKDGGEIITPCGGCPDCSFVAFVEELRKTCSVQRASITHWPGQSSSVVDVIVPTTEGGDKFKRVRKGSF